MLNEPSLSGTVIPSRTTSQISGSDVTRMIRIYFPRTFENLADYDFILLACTDMVFFTDKQMNWMYRGMAEEGLGGMNTRSVHSMSVAWSGPWMNSIVSDAFPNDASAVVNSDQYATETFAVGPLIVNDEQGIPPIVLPFRKSIEKNIRLRGVITIPRPGSRVYTWVRSGLNLGGGNIPGYTAHLFSWNYENATTFTSMDRVIEEFWTGRGNPFSMDLVSNVIWYSVGKELPQDALRVHSLRELFRQYEYRKSSLVSMFDFAENFGANTQDIYSRLENIESRKASAGRDYLQGDFEPSYLEMGEILDDFEKLEEDAIRLKNSALTWVFLIEWFAVSATFLVCGIVIWHLMIKRGAYREVSVTRLSES